MVIKKIIFSLFFLQLVAFSFGQQDSAVIKGTLKDAISKKPIQKYTVILSSKYGTYLNSTVTDIKGRFEFKIEKKKFQLEFNNQEYIDKSFFINDTNDVINLNVNLRPRNQTLTYADIDSSVINSKVRTVAKKFTLDLTDLDIISEPPGALRGFEFELPDSSIIYLFIERTGYFRKNKRKLLKQKIIGLGISRNNGEVYFFGEGKPLKVSLNNKYFDKN